MIRPGMTWICPSLIPVKGLDQRAQQIDPLSWLLQRQTVYKCKLINKLTGNNLEINQSFNQVIPTYLVAEAEAEAAKNH